MLLNSSTASPVEASPDQGTPASSVSYYKLVRCPRPLPTSYSFSVCLMNRERQKCTVDSSYNFTISQFKGDDCFHQSAADHSPNAVEKLFVWFAMRTSYWLFIPCSSLLSCSFQQDCDLARWFPTCSIFGIILTQMLNFVLLLIELHEVSANFFLWVSRHLFGLKSHISVIPHSVTSWMSSQGVLYSIVITEHQQSWTILAPKSVLGIFCWLLGTTSVLSHWSLPLQPRGATSLQPTQCSIHLDHVSSGCKLKLSGSSCQHCQSTLQPLLSLHPYSQSFGQRS